MTFKALHTNSVLPLKSVFLRAKPPKMLKYEKRITKVDAQRIEKSFIDNNNSNNRLGDSGLSALYILVRDNPKSE